MAKGAQAKQEQYDESVETAQAEKDAKIRAVFDQLVAEGKSEDEVKLAMIGAGATFKNVTRLYNEFMVAGGHAASKEERDQVLLSAVEGCDLTIESGFTYAVERLMANLKGSTERSAGAMIRGYAKKQGIEAFKRAKEASSGEGRTGFTTVFYDFLFQNPGCTKEQATAYIQGTDGNPETSENTKRHLSHYLNIWGLVNRIHSKNAA